MLNVFDEGLEEALINSRKDIAILYGSPLSTFQTSSGLEGVDNVNGVIKLIEEVIKSEYPRLERKYQESCLHGNVSDIEKYQKSFEFLHQFTDPIVPNEIIRQAVISAYKGEKCSYKDLEKLRSLEKDIVNWEIPPAIEYLGKILKDNDNFSGPILTTNFDPLLKIALEKVGGESTSLVFHNDGSLEKYIDERVKVIHLHGHWLESDTLHTTNQLSFSRQQLTNSLKKILCNKTLFVIGYGAWEDVFINALKEVAEDDDVELNIIWAFYEKSQETINSRYAELINKVLPLIPRGRFRAYSGIDCHKFLKGFYSSLSDSNEEEKDDIKIAETSIENDLSKWQVSIHPVNHVIRTTEREILREYLSKNNAINLVSDWGVSRDDFVFSALNTEVDKIPNFYRVDLTDVDSIDDFLDAFKDSLGIEIQQFITNLPKEDNYVFFDGFSSKNKVLIDKVTNVVDAMVDYNPFSKLIIFSDTVIDSNSFTVFSLGRLEEFDCIKYIKFFLGDNISEDALDSLVELSSGVPQYLKKLIEDLEYCNFTEVIENNSKPAEIIEGNEENIPDEIVRRVENLANSEDNNSQRAFMLLKTLCLLKHGDIYLNLKKMGQGYNYKVTHLKILDRLGLTKKSAVGNGIKLKNNSIDEEKIHEVKELVREYLFTKMSKNEMQRILKIIANAHFGKDWNIGSISLSNQNQKLLGVSSKFTLSLKFLAISLLRISIESDNSNLLTASLKLCLSYGSLLIRQSRYKQYLSFYREVKNIITDKSNDYEGELLEFSKKAIEALRMLSRRDEVIIVFESIKEKLEHFDNNQKASIYLDLALTYESDKNLGLAKSFALKVQSLESKGSSAYEQAQLIIESNSINISDLKKAEEKNRSSNNIGLANNIAINIATKSKDQKTQIKYLNRVISSGNSSEFKYSKYRAVVKKVIILKGKVDLNLLEGTLLSEAYTYSFGQRMKSLFRESHSAIWQHFYLKNDISNLSVLFKQSSIYWRIYDDQESEKKYAVILELLNNGIKFSKLDPYTRIRLKVLKSY